MCTSAAEQGERPVHSTERTVRRGQSPNDRGTKWGTTGASSTGRNPSKPKPYGRTSVCPLPTIQCRTASSRLSGLGEGKGGRLTPRQASKEGSRMSSGRHHQYTVAGENLSFAVRNISGRHDGDCPAQNSENKKKGEVVYPLRRKMFLVVWVIVGDLKRANMSVSAFDSHAHTNSCPSIMGPPWWKSRPSR